MKISVLMSIYNGSKYISDQLDSIRMQSYSADEVIIIDDCSVDDTVVKVNKYITMYGLQNNWKLYCNPVNKGWKKNFIDGVRKTSGDIIFFSDQDDIWLENKIKYTLSAFSNDVNVVATGEVQWNGINSNTYHCPEKMKKKEKVNLSIYKDYYIKCSGCTMAFRRLFYEKIISYYVEGLAHDDFMWKFGILDHSFLLLSEKTILHRIHNANESRKKRNYISTLEVMEYQLISICSMKRYIEENNSAHNDYIRVCKCLEHKYKGIEHRINFYKTKHPLLIIKLLLFYIDIYSRVRQILGDIFLVYGKKRT